MLPIPCAWVSPLRLRESRRPGLTKLRPSLLPLFGLVPSCDLHFIDHRSSAMTESVTSNAQQNVSLPNHTIPLPSWDQRITLFLNCTVIGKSDRSSIPHGRISASANFIIMVKVTEIPQKRPRFKRKSTHNESTDWDNPLLPLARRNGRLSSAGSCRGWTGDSP